MWWGWLDRDDPPLTDGTFELPRWAAWGFGLFMLLPIAVFVGLNVFVADHQLAPEDRAEVVELEDTLRPRGAVEDAVTRYEAVMQQVADQLSAQQPGLTWRWDKQTASSKCVGEFEDTSGVQLRRRLLADRPIPDDRWAAAHQLVRDHAAAVGVGYVSGVALPNGDGGAIDLTQRDAAVLTGLTPCLLRRDEIERDR